MQFEIVFGVSAILIICALAISNYVCYRVLQSMIKYNGELHDRLMSRNMGEYVNKKIIDKELEKKSEKTPETDEEVPGKDEMM